MTTPSLVAVLTAAVAAALLLGPRPRLSVERRRSVGPRSALVLAAVVGCLAVPSVGPLLIVAAGAAFGGAALWRRRRRDQEAQAVGAQVLESCELLAGELSAGQPPGQALARAAAGWPVLEPVAQAFRVGTDVPDALRRLAVEVDGAADLRVVAGAWQVAHRTGQGLGDTVDRVAASLRASAATRRLVRGELASARATARLVAGLPLLALLMGSGAGGDPWGFLFGTPAGLACLAGGLVCGFAGLWWIEAIARDAEEHG